MADDWQVGDKAVCVDARPFTGTAFPALKLGAVYTVHGLSTNPQGQLLLDMGKPIYGFKYDHPGAWRFRKIRPDKHEPCEEEFVTLIKREQVRA